MLFNKDGLPATIARDKAAIEAEARALIGKPFARKLSNAQRKLKKHARAARIIAAAGDLTSLPRPARSAPSDEQGVYVISDCGPVCKIGIAADPEARRRDLQIGQPEKIFVHYFSGPLPPGLARKIERECHRRLSALRRNGEWFATGWRDAADLVKHELAKAEQG